MSLNVGPAIDKARDLLCGQRIAIAIRKQTQVGGRGGQQTGQGTVTLAGEAVIGRLDDEYAGQIHSFSAIRERVPKIEDCPLEDAVSCKLL